MAPQYLQNFYIGQIPQMRRRSLPRRIRGLRARRLRKKTKGSACQPCKISTPGAFSACVCDLCGADGVQPGTAAQYGSHTQALKAPGVDILQGWHADPFVFLAQAPRPQPSYSPGKGAPAHLRDLPNIEILEILRGQWLSW